ncbi:MAG: hypothetical protein KBA18_09095 [Kiritimatiellae bacterium]|nr:hypothetical protein [Kiritimatiellia bacterium]
MQTSEKNVKVVTGWYEIDGKKIGDRVTVTTYRTARVGSGMERAGQISGTLVGMADESTRCYGCSFAWREAEIRVD